MHVCLCGVCVCMYACVSMLQPLHGGHGNTLLACLVAMEAPLTQTVWWRPGMARGPLHWSSLLQTIHHAYMSYKLATMHEIALAPGPRTQDCYCLCPIHPSGVLPPGLNSKLVNWLLSVPWLGREALLMEGWGVVYRFRVYTYTYVCRFVAIMFM